MSETEKNQDLQQPEAEAAVESTTEETEETAGTREVQEETAEVQPDPMEELRKELEETKDRLMRTLAEYDNFRKRTKKEREALYPEAEAGVLAKFLPFLDNFDRAMQSPCTDAEFLKGMQMIHQNFGEILSSMGVEAIGQEGETFDPSLHNAVMHEEDPELGENVISQVLQKGWRRGEKILRYAMVKTAN